MEKNFNSKGKINEPIRLILTLVILIGIAGGFLLYLAWPSLTGVTAVLATRPVDPFDPLRGQYITIYYEINNIPIVEGANINDDVYVALQPDANGTYRYKSASLSKPENGIFIKGRVKSLYSGRMNMEYGIEQYFFERNAQLPRNSITVEVKISSSGQARITHLLYKGRPAELVYKNFSITS